MAKTFSLDDYLKSNPVSDAAMKVHLRDNPCRGLIVGMSDDGTPVQVSWIMGRSPNSQNRVYGVDENDESNGELLKTQAFDEKKVEDPSLVIYTAMRSFGGLHVVGNGSQVDDAVNRINRGGSHYDYVGVLRNACCEPDAPTFTPRITGVYSSFARFNIFQFFLSVANPEAKAYWRHVAKECGFTSKDFEAEGKTPTQVTREYNQALSRASGLDYELFPTDFKLHDLQVKPGRGYMITTYMPGHETLDSFRGEPIPVPLVGGVQDIATSCWNRLEPEWRVAVAARTVGQDIPGTPYIINRHTTPAGK